MKNHLRSVPAVEDQIEELNELKKIIGGEADGRLLGLSKYHERMLRLLLARTRVTTEQMILAMYYDKMPDERPEPKGIGTMIHNLRGRLAHYKVQIHSAHSAGYWINEEDKAKLRKVIDDYRSKNPMPRSIIKRDAEAVQSGLVPGQPLSKKYKIEKGIQMPPAKQTEFPFGDKEFEVGDSFFVMGKNVSQMAHRWLVYKRSEKSEREFSARMVVGGVRVWRIK